MISKLEQLRSMTTIVADTGNIDVVQKFKPVDCTTNPTIVLETLRSGMFSDVIKEAIKWGKKQVYSQEDTVVAVADRLSVSIGAKLVDLIPGRISTEIDSDLSFSTQGCVDKARAIIDSYKKRGIERERVLIKIASTWEGICAAKILQEEGIDCNLTLIFSKAQAIACAAAGVFLISPFVGRISDYYKNKLGKEYVPEEDPGVLFVSSVYNYYKVNEIKTVVMGASFRSIGQIEALAGCDRLTISPKFLQELDNDYGSLSPKLSCDSLVEEEKIFLDEKSFRWMINEDPMANEKIAEGIRIFNRDLKSLRNMVRENLS
ncbi:Transaldolase [Liberibacter crescens BT-1]|uniref:Transaldolase n=1 Tax=Liberibacter crescens (strain BT-1) TaxID=1215343 RepID=L0EX48_LIBCB|nr:transaldolase [Liberibacter crescens]AGA64951.1 Transaldolase [Liberibacter crescens BT-1]AMC12972.1 transaldolase [Liberibacter crescens]